MSTKDFYGLLGISSDASQGQIRAAFIRISRVLHPDRFDPDKQPEDWKQANRMFSEVNEAWQILKDPEKRRRYDIQKGYLTGSAFSYSTSQASEPAPPDPGPDPTKELKAGSSPFSALPEDLRKRLLEREKAAMEEQYYVNTDTAPNHYLKAAALLVWMVFVSFAGMGEEWSNTLSIVLLLLTVGLSLYFSKHLFWLLKWHNSSLLSRIYITPLYIIRTHHDMVRWWPVYQIKDIRITNGRKYYSSHDTLLRLQYPEKSVNLHIAPIELARNCVHMLQQYISRIDDALANSDYAYIRQQDEFRDAASHPQPSATRLKYASFGIPLILMIALYGMVYSNNLGNEPQIGNRLISQFLPHNGSHINYFEGEAFAPLELHALKHQHFLVRISDAQTNRPVKTIFIRSGRQIQTQLPDGEYRIRYATGNYWYGPGEYFGPNGTFFREADTFSFKSEDNRLSGHLILLADSLRIDRGEIIEISASQF